MERTINKEPCPELAVGASHIYGARFFREGGWWRRCVDCGWFFWCPSEPKKTTGDPELDARAVEEAGIPLKDEA